MKKSIAAVCLLALCVCLQAQEVDLDKLLAAESKKSEKEEIPPGDLIPIFKTTRISNGHSVEVLPRGVLDMKIQHRFGSMKDGFENFWGLDNAIIRLGVDYGITDRLMVGLGRTTYQKQVDGFLKYKILQQSEAKGMPLTMTALASTMLRTDKYDETLPYDPYYTDRLSFAFQLMLARKFGEAFSLQLMPTLVHYNMVQKATDPNDIISLGIGGSLRLSKRTRFNVEYYYNLPDYKFEGTVNSLAFGFDIETGGHVFQLLFTNGMGVAEKPFITETTGKFTEGDIHFGFNISRVFQLGGKKKMK